MGCLSGYSPMPLHPLPCTSLAMPQWVIQAKNPHISGKWFWTMNLQAVKDAVFNKFHF